MKDDTFKVLAKIDKLVEQLPYESVAIDIRCGSESFTLNKEKQNVCGFLVGTANEK